MSSTELVLLALKLAISAGVVVTASFIIERSGPLVGALIASLPLSSGPIFVFLALEHGPEFLATTALGALPPMIGIAAFQYAYVRLAQRRRTLPAIAGALLVWAVVAEVVRALHLPFALLAPLTIGAYLLAFRLVRPYLGWVASGALPRRWWDIPFRGFMVALVTAISLLVGRLLGPGAAGLVALMPSVYVPLVLILQPRIGGRNTAAVLGIALPGMIGLTLGQIWIYLTATWLGSAWALLGGGLISMGWNLGVLHVKRAR